MPKEKSIEWGRLGIEAVAIVVSILLAFWIDAWWQDRSEIDSYASQLRALDNELKDNISQIEASIERTSVRLRDLDRVFRSLAGTDEISGSVYGDIGKALWFEFDPISTSAYREILSSGTLQRIQNPQLTSAIGSYGRWVNNVEISVENTVATYREEVNPVLIRYLALNELGWTFYESYVGPKGKVDSTTPSAPFPMDINALRSIEVWNTLYTWKVTKIDYVEALNNTKAAIEGVRHLLGEELERLDQ